MPTPSPHHQQPQRPSGAGAGGVDIEAWTESTVSAMTTLTLDPRTTTAIVRPPRPATPPIRGTAVTLDIPLDAETPLPRRRTPDKPLTTNIAAADADADNADQYPVYQRRTPLRRDSQRRREALLKGKEGSRRRQKWENDRLLGNPWREPPSPHDWEPRPTYPVHAVPYALAPQWDERRATAAADARAAESASNAPLVPRTLRDTLKRARGARGLLQDLEEEVRAFVRREQTPARNEGDNASDDEDEIIFAGRRAAAPSASSKTKSLASGPTDDTKMVFDAPAADRAGNFGYVPHNQERGAQLTSYCARRLLVHELAAYYGLRTWSVTVGDPARREAYVGVRRGGGGAPRCIGGGDGALPRPLYGMV